MMSGGNSLIGILLMLLHLASTSAQFISHPKDELENGHVEGDILSGLMEGDNCFDWQETGDLWQKTEGIACYCYNEHVYCLDKGPEELQGDIWQRRDGKFCYFFFDRVYCLEKDPECFKDYSVSRYWIDHEDNLCSTRCPILGPPSGGVICEMSKPRTPAPECLKDTTWINEQGAYCTCNNGYADCRGHPRVCIEGANWEENDGQKCACVSGEEQCTVCEESSVGTQMESYGTSCTCTCEFWGCNWSCKVFVAPDVIITFGARDLASTIPAHLNDCKYAKDGELKYAEYNSQCIKCEHCDGKACHVFNKRTCRCHKRPYCKA